MIGLVKLPIPRTFKLSCNISPLEKGQEICYHCCTVWKRSLFNWQNHLINLAAIAKRRQPWSSKILIAKNTPCIKAD